MERLDQASDVEHDLGAGDRAWQPWLIVERGDREIDAPGAEVVGPRRRPDQAAHLIAASNQRVDEMGADEPGRASDDDAHGLRRSVEDAGGRPGRAWEPCSQRERGPR